LLLLSLSAKLTVVNIFIDFNLYNLKQLTKWPQMGVVRILLLTVVCIVFQRFFTVFSAFAAALADTNQNTITVTVKPGTYYVNNTINVSNRVSVQLIAEQIPADVTLLNTIIIGGSSINYGLFRWTGLSSVEISGFVFQ
jgi:hypothetical protein